MTKEEFAKLAYENGIIRCEFSRSKNVMYVRGSTKKLFSYLKENNITLPFDVQGRIDDYPPKEKKEER